MFTYITTTTVPSLPALATLYNLDTAQTNWTVAIPAFGLAIGPLVWSSPADILGRRIIFITGTLIALASTVGAATASTYNAYMAARFFQGFGVSPAATVGLAIINDTFFEYQRGQKVGLWVLAIDMGLVVGPLFGGYINEVNQAWVQWVTAILFGAILVAEILFLPETLYPRKAMLSLMPIPVDGSQAVIDVEKSPCKKGIASDVPIKRTRTLAFLNFAPVPILKHPKPWDATVRFVKMWKYAVIPLAVCIYSFAWYWWILSIMTYVPVAYSQYPPPIQGLLFIGLILGTLFSEIFFSGALGDRIARKLARANGGVRVAEMRLWPVYPAAVMSAVGLIVWGVSVDKGYHWIVGQVAFFWCKDSTISTSPTSPSLIYVFTDSSSSVAAGIQTSNTCVSAYIVDAYPRCSTAVITFYAVLLNLSAFINPFFITPWVDSVGFTWTFATQGIITLVVGGGGLGLLHLFADRYVRRRERQGL